MQNPHDTAQLAARIFVRYSRFLPNFQAIKSKHELLRIDVLLGELPKVILATSVGAT